MKAASRTKVQFISNENRLNHILVRFGCRGNVDFRVFHAKVTEIHSKQNRDSDFKNKSGSLAINHLKGRNTFLCRFMT